MQDSCSSVVREVEVEREDIPTKLLFTLQISHIRVCEP